MYFLNIHPVKIPSMLAHGFPGWLSSFPTTSCRKDKYDGTKEYWVDVETTGSFENEAEETITERTSVEGQGSEMDLGLTAPVPAACGDPEGGSADDSSEEDEEDGTDGTASSISKRKTTPVEESALEEEGSKKYKRLCFNC